MWSSQPRLTNRSRSHRRPICIFAVGNTDQYTEHKLAGATRSYGQNLCQPKIEELLNNVWHSQGAFPSYRMNKQRGRGNFIGYIKSDRPSREI